MQDAARETDAVGHGLSVVDTVSAADVEGDRPVESGAWPERDYARRYGCARQPRQGGVRRRVRVVLGEASPQLRVLVAQPGDRVAIARRLRHALHETSHRTEHAVGAAIQGTERTAPPAVRAAEARPREVDRQEEEGDGNEHRRG